DVLVSAVAGDPVALVLSIQQLPSSTARSGAELREYRISVANLGQQTASAVQVSVPVPGGLTGLIWTCATAAGCTPMAGEAGIATTFDLGSGQSATLDLIGEVLPGVAFVDIVAHASTASGGGAQT